MYRVFLMQIIGPVFQIIAAIIIVIFLFAIGFLIFNMEMVTSSQDAGKLKKSVPIFTGMVDMNSRSNTGNGGENVAAFNTVNPTDPSYKPITPSVNQPSGAELSYNFWLYKTDTAFQSVTESGARMTTDAGLSSGDFILFVQGENRSQDYPSLCGKNKRDIKVKCPLVKLERGGKVLTVEFNTMASPDAVHEQSRNTCNDDSRSWNAMNAHKLAIYTDNTTESSNFNEKWFMVTVVLNDTTPNDPLPLRNKVRCRIYINGNLELDRYVDDGLGMPSSVSTLRRNTGNLYVGPQVKVDNTNNTQTFTGGITNSKKLLMADLTYYNYAVSEDEIKSFFSKGFTKSWAEISSRTPDTARDLTSSELMSLASSGRQFNAF